MLETSVAAGLFNGMLHMKVMIKNSTIFRAQDSLQTCDVNNV